MRVKEAPLKTTEHNTLDDGEQYAIRPITFARYVYYLRSRVEAICEVKEAPLKTTDYNTLDDGKQYAIRPITFARND